MYPTHKDYTIGYVRDINRFTHRVSSSSYLCVRVKDVKESVICLDGSLTDVKEDKIL